MVGQPASVAILAGGGSLPLALADALSARQINVSILAFRGFAAQNVAQRAHAIVDLLDVQATLAWLEQRSPSCVVLVGTVIRPHPSAVIGAFAAYRSRKELGRLMAAGDDQLLGGVLRLLEDHGFTVAGIASLAPELLGRPGQLGTVQPNDSHNQAIAMGLDVLDTLSRFDAGQAVVISGRRVIAVEGPEGTDAMLRRVYWMRLTRRWKADRGGVLVKAPKLGQDYRVDLPAVGPRTVKWAARAGLLGIAYGAGRTLVIDEADMVQQANRKGLFVLGVSDRDAEEASSEITRSEITRLETTRLETTVLKRDVLENDDDRA